MNTYKQQTKATIVAFLIEQPSLIAVAISAIVSGSLIVWVDFLDSFCNVVREGVVSFVSLKLQSNLKYKYNYGIAKIEALCSMMCDFIMAIGVSCVFFCSIYQIFVPSKESDFLFYVILLKIINILLDLIIVYRQYKIKKVENNNVVNTEFAAVLKNLYFDVAILATTFICYILRNESGSVYISPVVCMIISVIVVYKAIRRISSNINELTDKTLSEEMQFKIIRVLNKYFDKYEKLLSIDSHKLGNKLHVDLAITFQNKETYEEIIQFLDSVSKDLEDVLPGCEISLVINKE